MVHRYPAVDPSKKDSNPWDPAIFYIRAKKIKTLGIRPSFISEQKRLKSLGSGYLLYPSKKDSILGIRPSFISEQKNSNPWDPAIFFIRAKKILILNSGHLLYPSKKDSNPWDLAIFYIREKISYIRAKKIQILGIRPSLISEQ